MTEVREGRPVSVRSRQNNRLLALLSLPTIRDMRVDLATRELTCKDDRSVRSEVKGFIQLIGDHIKVAEDLTRVLESKPATQTGSATSRPAIKLPVHSTVPDFSGSQLHCIKSAVMAAGRSEAVQEARRTPGVPFVEPLILPVIGSHSVIIMATFREDCENGTDFYSCAVNDVALGKDCHIKSNLILKDPTSDRELCFYDGKTPGEKLNCFAVHAVEGMVLRYWHSYVSRDGSSREDIEKLNFVVHVSPRGDVTIVPE